MTCSRCLAYNPLGNFDSHLLTGDDKTYYPVYLNHLRFWLTSPHRRWRWVSYEVQSNNTNFDSHLLTGDDSFIKAGIYRNSDFDSHLLTGDDNNVYESFLTDIILTHISSPEMTSFDQEDKICRTYFDSHLLTGDDPGSSRICPWRIYFDSHLLTGDDRNILISTILPDTKYPFFFK